MIFPILNGFQSIFRTPVTWALFFLNFLVLIFTFSAGQTTQVALEKDLMDPTYSEMQGVVFAHFIESHKARYPASMQTLARESMIPGETDRRQLLGGLALRDNDFLQSASDMSDNIGDPVAFKWWTKKVAQMKNVRDENPSYALGLTTYNSDFTHWITYQFSHSGFAHFAGNMLFFLLFSCSLELLIGGLGVLVLYIICGIAAALSFLLMSGASAIPLIGASGAISGLVAFFCVLMWGRGIRYVFCLFVPKKGYTGIIYLPAWVTLVIWMLSDLAGQVATPSELGGIAYSAHLGGEMCGIVAALTLIAFRKWRGLPVLPEKLAFETKPVLTRFV